MSGFMALEAGAGVGANMAKRPLPGAKGRLPAEGTLLSREDFQRFVFLRAGGCCVYCSSPAVNAHHILERKLFPETGGYFLGNGAAVCEAHHWQCETTEFTVEDVRRAAGIVNPPLPPGFDANTLYDKWGNVLLPDSYREVGPLATDTGMRKALQLGHVFHLLKLNWSGNG